MEVLKFKTVPTLLLVGANIAMYVYTSLLSGNFVSMSQDVLLEYGQFNLYVAQGYYWQLFSSMFVHANIVHLASNMIFLFVFGLRAEDLFPTTEYYFIYFASGLAGNLLSFLGGRRFFYNRTSGAIFGVFGANVIFLRRAVGQPIAVSLMYAFLFFVLTVSAGTNIFAHLGGLVTGLVLGYFLAGAKKIIRVRSRYGV